MAIRTLNFEEARRAYDRIGSFQDSQAFYEDAALDLLARDRVPNGHTLIALQWLQIHGAALRRRWS